MTSVSISQLKTAPSRIISDADDYPVAIKNRSKTAGYIVGKDLFETLVAYIEDSIDRKAVEETDYTKGRDFDEIAEELGI